jgi:hypothetical protein
MMPGRNLGDASATALLISNDLHTFTVYAVA